MKKITFLIALFVASFTFAQQSLVEDFESSPTISGFEGLGEAVIAAAPSGSNGNSFKLVTDPTNGQPWQGAQVDLASGILADLSNDKTMQIDVYSTTAFALMVKLEDKVNNTAPAAANTQSHTGSGWETLTFTFTTGSDGTSTANGDYSRVVFFPNRKADDTGWNDPKVDVTIYVDNIKAVKKEVTVNPDPEPSEAAPTPPTRDAADVISLFSDAYSNISIQTLPESWSQHGSFDGNYMVAGNATWKIGPANDFLGMTISDAGVDISGMDKIHIDYWTENDIQIGLKLVSGAGQDPLVNFPATVTGSWQSVDLDISSFTSAGFDATKLLQLLIDPAAANLMYVDNVYFYKDSGSGGGGGNTPTELLTDGDFEAQSVGAVTGAWYGAGEIRNDGGGNYFFADVQTAANAYDVNLSQKGLNLTEGKYYKLKFTASSNVSRTAVVGIGLSADPWTSQVETIDLTTDSKTYELTLQANFTNADARVIFDLGAAVGHVVLDDVSLVETTAPVATGPTTTAPAAPTFNNASDASLIFSGSNTATGFSPNDFAGATVSTVQVDGDDVIKIEVPTAGGGANLPFAAQDMTAAGFTHFYFHYYTEATGVGKVFNVQIQGGTANYLYQIALPASKGNTTAWQTVNVAISSMNDLTGGTGNLDAISQVQITGAGPSNPIGDIYIDNVIFYKDGTASTETNELFNVSVSPNPASSVVNLRADETITKAEVYNILGKKVRSFNVNATSTSFNISDLNAGIYLLKYEINNKVGTTKFVKQ